jgi:glycosyltransferase involved in cell wall biosynthesis
VVAVHQFVPTLAPRDAVSGHYMRVRTALRTAGYTSDIYAMDARGELSKEAKPFQNFRGGRQGEPTWLCYHSSIGSPVAGFVAERPEPLIVDYHNITPAAFFDRWEPGVAVYLRAGRRQLRSLAARTALGIADSSYNAGELEGLGFRPTGVVPILFDRDDLHVDIDRVARERLASERPDGSSTWLFVGQVAPHKAQHDIVKALAAYRRVFDPKARLRIVGFPLSRSYTRALVAYVDDLGLTDAVDIAGSVPDAVLGAYYATADVFVCLSEHEGFCVTLLEAMHHDVPVVAYAAGAVPETLGTGGLLLEQKDPLTVATAVARILLNGTGLDGTVSEGAVNGDSAESMRTALTRAGRERLHAFDLSRSEATLRAAIASVAGTP